MTETQSNEYQTIVSLLLDSKIPLPVSPLPPYVSKTHVRLDGNGQKILTGKIALTNIVIGCGGTGSYIVPHLARLSMNLNNKLLPSLHAINKCNIILVDNDIIEEKNITRQNFINKDIGLNKAEVLANRYSSAFGCDILSNTSHVSTLKDILNSLHECIEAEHINLVVLFSLVDTVQSRLDIIDIAKCITDYVDIVAIIDAGNHRTNGQVVLTLVYNLDFRSQCRIKSISNPNSLNLTGSYYPRSILPLCSVNNIIVASLDDPIIVRNIAVPTPSLIEWGHINPNLRINEEQEAEEMDCELIADIEAQSFGINNLAASISLNYLMQLLTTSVNPNRSISSVVTMFSTNGVFSYIRPTMSMLKNIIPVETK